MNEQKKTTQILKPTLLRRLAAILYDGILLLALLIFIGGSWVSFSTAGSPQLTWGLRIIFVLLPSCFFSYFWLKSGQTLGMTTWRIKLRSLDNSPLKSHQIAIRLITATLSIACLGLGYAWMLIDKDKLTWHDRLSKTYLEFSPKVKTKK